MLAIAAATVISSAGTLVAQARPNCAGTQPFQSNAPSDIGRQAFEAHDCIPLNRVVCRDNGLCYQKWGNNCTQAQD
ncbi:MAG: hypothetical protein ACKO0M_08045 [Cyanobium sp.]